MGTAARSRIQNRRNVLWLGLLLAVLAMIGGGSLVLNTRRPRPPIASPSRGPLS